MSEGSESFEMRPFLRGAETAEDGGTDEVDGTSVRVITGTIDQDKALSETSPEEQEGLENTFSITQPPDRFDYEVGVDGDGRVRSLDLEIEATDDEGTGASLSGNLRLEVRSFDQPVEVEPPPADETVLLEEVPGLVEVLSPGG